MMKTRRKKYVYRESSRGETNERKEKTQAVFPTANEPLAYNRRISRQQRVELPERFVAYPSGMYTVDLAILKRRHHRLPKIPCAYLQAYLLENLNLKAA